AAPRQPLQVDNESCDVARRVRDVIGVPIADDCTSSGENDLMIGIVTMAGAHGDFTEGGRGLQAVDQLLGPGSQVPTFLGYKARLPFAASEDSLDIQDLARRRGQSVEPRQPSPASFRCRITAALLVGCQTAFR